MKLFGFSIGDFSSRLQTHRAHVRVHAAVMPYRDWTVILLVTLVLMVLVCAVSVYLFVRVEQGSLFVTTAGPTPVENIVNQHDLTTLLDAYRRKEAQFTALTGVTPTFTMSAVSAATTTATDTPLR